MKTVTAILVIFYACLHAADNKEVKPANIMQDVVSNIGKFANQTVHTIIPDCVFGVKSVSMVLYTRDIPYGKNIGLDEVCNNFDPLRPIVFLVHGFISDANYTNSYMLSEALVKNNYTVFSLDWSDAACTTALSIVKFLGYPSAVQNTREVGELMASYVTSLIDKCGVPLDNMIFLGHSLGAHVCGFASKNIRKDYGLVPLLFGVDPAQPLFELNDCDDRFCDTDANTTFALHTSSLGISRPIAHIDLYFDGGFMQPGCGIDISCSHSRAVLYLTDVVNDNNCGFPGTPMSYMDIMLPLIIRPSYPKSDTTDCFLMNYTIFDKNRGFDKLKEKGTFYMFVHPKTFCAQQSFSCQY